MIPVIRRSYTDLHWIERMFSFLVFNRERRLTEIDEIYKKNLDDYVCDRTLYEYKKQNTYGTLVKLDEEKELIKDRNNKIILSKY